MSCCNDCKGFPVSCTGPTALSFTSECLMLLLKLMIVSGRPTPRHTDKHQALLWDHQWEGINPIP